MMLLKTPYQRLLDSADLSIEAKSALTLKYEALNPFELRLKLEMELKDFFSLLRRDHNPGAGSMRF